MLTLCLCSIDYAKEQLTKTFFQDKNIETTHVMPILPPPTYEQVQNDRLQEVENFYKQNQDRNSRNDFTIIEFGGPQQESSAPMNRMLDLELNEQRLRGKSFIILLFLILLSLQPNDPKKSMGKQVVPLLLLLSFFLFSSSSFALE